MIARWLHPVFTSARALGQAARALGTQSLWRGLGACGALGSLTAPLGLDLPAPPPFIEGTELIHEQPGVFNMPTMHSLGRARPRDRMPSVWL
jgi:hypothetical protein